MQDKAELTRDEMANIIGQITTEWDFDTAKTLAEANLTAASTADKGDVYILAPNDGTARAIADTFAADADVSSYVITGQDAEEASVQYIIDGKQSMTVLKDVRTLVADAIAAAVDYLNGQTPPATTTYNNGVIDVPASPLRSSPSIKAMSSRRSSIPDMACCRLHRPQSARSVRARLLDRNGGGRPSPFLRSGR